MTDLAAARFDLIAPLLRRYKRRFSVLDLGAGINPYLAQRISNEFDCCYTLIEQDEIAPEELAKLGPRAMWLRKKMSAGDLLKLSNCEHFDVVIAFNILHHFGEKWRYADANISRMGDWVITQTPTPDDLGSCGTDITPEIHSYLVQEGALLGESVNFDGHKPRPIFQREGFKPWTCGAITMSSWTSPMGCIDARITADFDKSEIEIRNDDGTKPRRPYIHGLNLWNFAQLNGQWPRKDAVLKLIREFPVPGNHGDVVPHNFLFDGAELHLIDGHEGWEFDDKAGLEKTAEMVEEALNG